MENDLVFTTGFEKDRRRVIIKASKNSTTTSPFHRRSKMWPLLFLIGATSAFAETTVHRFDG